MGSGSWTLNYLPEEGGRITGTLIVSDEDVRFEALYDSSNKEILKGIGLSLGAFAATGGHSVYIHDTDTEFTLVIPRPNIAGAESVKKGMMKRAVVTTTDDQRFVFDYGMLSVKKVVAAIND